MDTDQRLESAFALFDKDGDGLLLVQDVAPALMSTGLFVREKDLDAKCGDVMKVKKDVFLTWGKELFDGRDPKTELEKAFGLFDHDRNGTISTKEFEFVADSIGNLFIGTDIADMVRICDPDGSGSMTYGKLIDSLLA
ncbi:MAG: uncharacterized protein KVP18_000008 [Porospora cf. gigantea A]|uniref:uncharacterized protein n=1 Tax=Porospora cf. gigantea A TaxID=2853593 RepID=UPI003559F484|nr:MAG: hypothetical protein KVP18_000008 [Porospora cf. gigantea A]